MCPPTKFDVNYIINPWMEGNIDKVDKHRAAQQWSDVRNALVQAGADVIVCPTPSADCPDAVFMANAGLMYNNTVIISHFKHEERVPEEAFFKKWFHNHHYETPNTDYFVEGNTRKQMSFEGAGDALFNVDRSILWMGFGFRSTLSYKRFIEVALEKYGEKIIVRPLELVNPNFYHLDTCFCPLDSGELLWYPDAFSEHSRYVIESWYAGKSITVETVDAMKFACNAVSVGKTIVLPEITPSLAFQLEDRGYNVVQVNMDQFLRSGGACKCLTLEAIVDV